MTQDLFANAVDNFFGIINTDPTLIADSRRSDMTEPSRKKRRVSDKSDVPTEHNGAVVIRWEWHFCEQKRGDLCYYTMTKRADMSESTAIMFYDELRIQPISQRSVMDASGMPFIDSLGHWAAFGATHTCPPRPCGSESKCECHVRNPLELPVSWTTKEPWKRYKSTRALMDAEPDVVIDKMWTIVLKTECSDQEASRAWEQAECTQCKKQHDLVRCKYCTRRACRGCVHIVGGYDKVCPVCAGEKSQSGKITRCRCCEKWIYINFDGEDTCIKCELYIQMNSDEAGP